MPYPSPLRGIPATFPFVRPASPFPAAADVDGVLDLLSVVRRLTSAALISAFALAGCSSGGSGGDNGESQFANPDNSGPLSTFAYDGQVATDSSNGLLVVLPLEFDRSDSSHQEFLEFEKFGARESFGDDVSYVADPSAWKEDLEERYPGFGGYYASSPGVGRALHGYNAWPVGGKVHSFWSAKGAPYSPNPDMSGQVAYSGHGFSGPRASTKSFATNANGDIVAAGNVALGFFDMTVDFDQAVVSSFEYSGNIWTPSASGSTSSSEVAKVQSEALALDLESGRFDGNVSLSGEHVGALAGTGEIQGQLHGEGGTYVSGVFYSSVTDPSSAYAGSFSGERRQ